MQKKGSARRVSFLLSAVFLAFLMTGFFHLPPEIKVTSLKQVAGTYEGTYTLTSGKEIEVKLTIKADGTYEGSSPKRTVTGKVRIKDGILELKRDGREGWSTGTIRENKEKRVLLTVGERGEGWYEMKK